LNEKTQPASQPALDEFPIQLALLEERRLVREGLESILSREAELELRPPRRLKRGGVVLLGKSDREPPEGAAVIALDDSWSIPELLEMIRAAGSQPVTSKMSSRVRKLGLSPRQLMVLEAVGRGRAASDIASELGISRRTVEWHKRAVMTRLGVNTPAQAIAQLADLDASERRAG
jgi:DNA-binding CsgD family transcriptional regulator